MAACSRIIREKGSEPQALDLLLLLLLLPPPLVRGRECYLKTNNGWGAVLQITTIQVFYKRRVLSILVVGMV